MRCTGNASAGQRVVVFLTFATLVAGCTARREPPRAPKPGLRPAAGEWTRQVVSSYLGPQKPKVRFSARTDAWVLSAPAATRDGTTYFALGPTLVWPTIAHRSLQVREDNRLVALDAKGHVKWTLHLGLPAQEASATWPGALPPLGCSSPALGPDGTIYYGTRAGKLFAVSPSGSVKWSVSVGPRAGITTPVLIDKAGRIICVRAGTTRLWALSPAGMRLWVFAPKGLVSSSSFGADGTCYVTVLQGKHSSLWAVARDGTPRRLSLAQPAKETTGPASGLVGPAEVLASPDDRLYVADKQGLHAFKTDGSRLWDFTARGRVTLPVGVGGDLLCVGTKYGSDRPGYPVGLAALRLDGRVKWVRRIIEAADAAPQVMDRDGNTYAVCERNSWGGDPPRLFVAYDRTGRLKWKREIGKKTGSSVVLGPNRTLYFGCVNVHATTGAVYAVGETE